MEMFLSDNVQQPIVGQAKILLGQVALIHRAEVWGP
jgi:hypothetical protein